MSSVSPNPHEPAGSWGFTFRRHAKRERRLSSFSQVAVEISAAGTSVAAYHPLRTIATQLSAGVPLQWQFAALYRGFFPSACGAHQLFLMAALNRQLKELFFNNHCEPNAWQRILIGGTAGLFSTTTVVPFEMLAVQRQLNRPFVWNHWTQLYRGYVPLACRQFGLGAGMFTLPSLLEEKLRQAYPDHTSKHPQKMKFSVALFCGCATATATQFFEAARLLMQEDVSKIKYPTTWKAFQAVPNQLFSPRGSKMYAVRLSVVAVATVVMNQSRDFFSHLFGKEET